MNSLLLLIPTLFIIGCSESIHTEKYYKDHPKERILKLKECKHAFRANKKQIEILDSKKYNYKY